MGVEERVSWGKLFHSSCPSLRYVLHLLLFSTQVEVESLSQPLLCLQGSKSLYTDTDFMAPGGPKWLGWR